ncbi:MAG: MFS transporter [Bacteroidetes bacterium]|nr:MFS transporter [Bacteroidota bacterium]
MKNYSVVRVKYKDLLLDERRTFLIHFTYSFIEGIIMGVLVLNEFVLIKSLKGTDYQIGLLFQFSVVLMFFSVLFNELVKRSRNKPKLIKWIGIFTRLPLLIFLIFPHFFDMSANETLIQIAFLGVFLVFYLANPIILPTINLFLKTNYQHKHFGPLYSYSTTINKVVMLGSTFGFGLLLDRDPNSFLFVYPVIGLLGMLSIFLFSKIPFQPSKQEIKTTVRKSLKSSISGMFEIIKTNKPYRDFEIGFMLYGFAWMTTIAVITIFFADKLHLSYSSVAFYKNSYNLIAILILPFFGRLINKIDPRKFAVFTFGSLMLYLVFLALTEHLSWNTEIMGIQLYYMLIPAFLAHAVFAATMSLLWFIGSSYFSRSDSAADYQSVHLTLTGARGLFAPLLGVLFYEIFGFTITFSIAIFALIIAMVLMYWSMKNRSMNPESF